MSKYSVALEVNRKTYKASGDDPVQALDNLGLTVFDVKTKSTLKIIKDGKTFEAHYPLMRLRNLLRDGSQLRKGLPMVLSKYFGLK